VQNQHSSPPAAHPARAMPRNDLQFLLKSRWVQGLLVATAAVTVTGTVAGKNKGDAQGAMAAAGTEAVEGSVVVPLVSMSELASETVEAAWRRHAVERESQRLAAKYVQRGYNVTPDLARNIQEAALKFDIDPEIAFGLVRAESSFRNQATSPVGAVGLTQLMPRTAAWIEPGVTRAQLRNPRTNLEVGFKYLRYLLDKYDGNEDLALLAYNRGPGTVDRALRRGASPDNGYAAFVRGEANHGHRLFTNPSRSAAQRTPARRTPARGR
jgi:soluble lytic murein transglycosylase-like protein